MWVQNPVFLGIKLKNADLNYLKKFGQSQLPKKFRKFRYLEKLSKRLFFIKPPAWIYLHGKQNYAESSLIRKKNEN